MGAADGELLFPLAVDRSTDGRLPNRPDQLRGGLAVGEDGFIYVADGVGRIRKFAP